MEKIKIELIKLVASDGMTLTNGESFGKIIHLGSGDSVENWYEITDEEAQQIQEKLFEEEVE